MSIYRNAPDYCSCPNGCASLGWMWYDSKWDRHFCAKCNIWLEEGCGCKEGDNTHGIECYFECWKCPEKPMENL